MSGQPEGGRAAKRFVGYALMTVGGLIAVVSGLCTGGFWLYGLVVLAQDGGGVPLETGLAMMGTTGLVGGIPALFGVGLFFIGRRMVRATA